MAIKDLFSWITGDVSNQSWPPGASEVVRKKNVADQASDDTIVKSEWFTTTSSNGGGMQSKVADAIVADAHREIARMREELSKNGGSFGRRQMMKPLAPQIDENSSEYRVTLELSGYAESDIKIEARDNSLVVSAERRSNREDTDNGRSVSEHFVTRFERTVRLNGTVDPAGITSTLDNGTLRITARKK